MSGSLSTPALGGVVTGGGSEGCGHGDDGGVRRREKRG